MAGSIARKIRDFFTSGGERSSKMKKNLAAMVFIKGGNVLVGFLLVPLTINYVNSETYGIWITISSMVAWISFFDIGINNGLKNKLTEALAAGDRALAGKYVSTTYAILALIFIPLMLILLLVVPVLDWQSLLNVNAVDGQTLVLAMCITVVYFCLNFIFSTINVILLSDQRPADESLRTFMQQLFTLAVIFVMTKCIPGSLISLCIALCLCPLAVLLLFNFTLFSGRYRDIAPSLQSVDFKVAPSLLKLGVQFFIIQIAYVVQYQMINFLIIHYFGAGEVTSYNIAYKYFNIAYMLWSVLTVPVWAAVTDAVAKGEFTWVKDTTRKYLKLFLVFAAGSALMLAAAPLAYHIWVGDAVTVPFELSLWVMLYNLVFMFANIFVTVLNGASILKVQTIASIVSPLVFLGLSLLLIHNGFGVKSILISSIAANFNGLILAPVQYRHFIRKNHAQRT